MRKNAAYFLCLVLIAADIGFAASPDGSVIKTDIVTISLEKQHDFVNPYSNSALAVRFDTQKGWHFYASEKTAPGGLNLKIIPSAEPKNDIIFSEPIFPPFHFYFDKTLNEKIEVFSDKFMVFLPFRVADIKTAPTEKEDIETVTIAIEGAVCSDVQCRVPDFGQLNTKIRIAFDRPLGEAKFVLPEAAEQSKPVALGGGTNYSFWFALGLAFLAGLSLNIMPCVWPVLPLVILRIVEQAKTRATAKLTMGLAFCIGILLFFACLAVVNIVLRVSFGTTLQWGDQFRNPVFIKVMALVLVALALFMFDVFSFTLPSSISGKASGSAGTTGMGFLAAVLSTPCSFGILAAAFAWAQSQPLLPATIAILVIGLGMALPYLVLVSIPGLLESLPKPGRWMDIFKKAVGFILLALAVWMITIVPQQGRTGVLFYALVLAFCVWMWGGWVGFDSKISNKIIVRAIAILLAVGAGFWLLGAPKKALIDWKGYDAGLIEKSITANKPVLIKFTADWCLSCKAVQKLVYDRKDIVELINQKGVVAIKADTTAKEYPATKALKDIYNEPGVPVTLLFLPGQKEPIRWHSKTFGDELKESLENIK